jgi:hypothetical protein
VTLNPTPVNVHLLIDAIVQQTMVLIAQLATTGGARAPLVKVADQVFADLTTELQNQGVTKKVIADMFGMALRTYHRRVQETRESRSEVGSTVWEAVLSYVRKHEPVSAAEILTRFSHDDREVVSGVLNDLANSGLAYRTGRGDRAVFRAAQERDLGESTDDETLDWLMWLTVYRRGPAELVKIAESARVGQDVCEASLHRLMAADRVTKSEDGLYVSDRFETALGTSSGWEAAVLDHFQAMSAALCSKLATVGQSSDLGDTVGGSTWSLDVWDGHPLQEEAITTLRRLREETESLRKRIDDYNAQNAAEGASDRVVVYVGQYRVRD